MKLKNKVAIVTGAGSGNGRAIALKYFEEGAFVVVADIDEKGANETIEIADKKDNALFVKVDISKKDEVIHMIDKTVAKFGKVDILVNNAGIVGFTPFLELSEEEWDKIHDVNLKGTFLCSQATAKVMIDKKVKGRIINISSVEAHIVLSSSGETQPHYNSSKGGVHMFSQALALELSKYGITSNCIAPGFVETPFTQKALQNPTAKKWILDRVPLGRVAQPEDIANVALFYAHDESEYITGTTQFVDGGWTIQ